ncbi:MAG: hypothetical protein ABMA01_08895, partial [Chthoniobacteraceae bacterium]
MATCGNYELDRAIGWGRRATFFSARAGDGGGGDFLLVIRRARSGERGFSQAFLRSAADQQAAVGAGCRRLAPILSFEVDHCGFAYYATTRFEASLAEFLDADCRVDGALLREIVAGVLGALSELHEKSRRAHGNITPGNILLDSQGRIFLTDLAPAGKDATVADDLVALGTLIYQLVRRTARVGVLTPPLEYSPEWTDALGDDAEAWREFTNRLLDKSRHKGQEAIKTASSDLKSLKSLEAKASTSVASATQTATEGAARKPPPKRRLLPKLAALFLVASGVGCGLWYTKHQKDLQVKAEKKRIDEERRLKFEEALGAKLKPFRDAIQGTLPPLLADDKDLQYIFKRIKPDLEVRESNSQISPEEIQSQVQLKLDEWPVREKLKNQAAAWRATPREWKRFADTIESASQITVAAGGNNDQPLIQQLLNARQRLNQADAIEARWGEVDSALASLKQMKISLLPVEDFRPWAAGELGNVVRMEDVPDRASSVLEKLKDVRGFCEKDWPRVLQDRFKAEAADVLKPPSPERMGEWPREWVRQAQRFLRPPDEKLVAWEKQFARAEAKIPKRPAGERPTWSQKLQDARAARDAALDTDVARIDRLVAEFNGLRDPLEEAHEQYVAFLGPWKAKAASAGTKKEADAALQE